MAMWVLASACGATDPSQSPQGHWVGVAPDGMVATVNPRAYCPGEFDLDMTLTGSGGGVEGSATLRLRKTAGNSCADVLGLVKTLTLFHGTVDGNSISFDLGSTAAYRFSGRFTATRMAGTFEITEFPESGTFAVNRQ